VRQRTVVGAVVNHPAHAADAPALELPLADALSASSSLSLTGQRAQSGWVPHQVDSSSSFDSPAIDTLTTAPTMFRGDTDAGHSYYWRVLSRTSCGEGGLVGLAQL